MRFLFVDRILHLSPGKSVRGIKHITHDDAYLCYDEQGRLCFISSLIGETLGQLAAWNVMSSNDFTARPVAGVVSSAQLHRAAYPGETLLLESVIDALDEQAVQYHSRAYVENELIFSIDGALGPLLPMSNFIDESVVRRQFQEINRPGDWPSERILGTKVEPLAMNIGLPKLVTMQFDHILHCEPNVGLTAEKRITRAAPYFDDHFPNNPVLPMTVLLECKLNLAHTFLAKCSFEQTYQISELRKIKMNEFIHPGEVLTCQLKVKEQNAQQLILSYRTEVDGKRVCVLELVMKAKGI